MTLKSHLTNGNSGEGPKILKSKALISFLVIIIMLGSNCAAHDICPAIMIDMVMGEPISVDSVLDDLSKVKIVYLGEHHTIARHHRVQLDIIKGLSDRGISISIGMEMFSRDQQSILNDWLNTREGINGLALKLGSEGWTNLRDYSEILNYAREIGIPVLGINASDALVRTVAREGLEGLSSMQRQIVPDDVEDINPQYEKLLRLKLQVHKSFKEKKLDRIILAQAVRDSVMAQSIIEFAQSNLGSDRVVVVIAGGGHLNYGFGIPERVSKHMNVPFRIVLPSESGELVLSEKELQHAAPIEITHSDLSFIRVRIADYLSVLPLKQDHERPGPETVEARAL
ncbi:MAG: ChaN family lipoprotein [Syntrophaceae bacterium]|nr:ChaN family lipoprotein [Syntrophaceae bacterium]